VAFHAFEDGKQPVDFPALQCSRRLVEHKHATAPPQRLGDGDELAPGKTEPIDPHARVRRKVELSHDRPGLLDHPSSVDDRNNAQEAALRRISHHQVLGDRKGRHQVQLLGNGYDSGQNRVVRTRQFAGDAIDCDLAEVGPQRATEDTDQCGFSGSVLADQGMNFARHDGKAHAIERGRCAVPLGDVRRADRWRIHSRDIRQFYLERRRDRSRFAPEADDPS
jgi:hypothetical protein